MSTRRSSTGSTRGTETPPAKKAPAKRARASRSPDTKQETTQETQQDKLQGKQQEVKQDVPQELSMAPAVAAREARHDGPPPVAPRAQVAPPGRIEISPDARRAMVAESAYLRAERRGFAHGGEVEDWLAAEAEVDKLLQSVHGTRPQ